MAVLFEELKFETGAEIALVARCHEMIRKNYDFIHAKALLLEALEPSVNPPPLAENVSRSLCQYSLSNDLFSSWHCTNVLLEEFRERLGFMFGLTYACSTHSPFLHYTDITLFRDALNPPLDMNCLQNVTLSPDQVFKARLNCTRKFLKTWQEIKPARDQLLETLKATLPK